MARRSPTSRSSRRARTGGQHAHLRTVGVDGARDAALTVGGGPDDGPEYSPDGEWIYFNTERFSAVAGHAQIARIRPDGSGLEQLTFDERVNWFPHLSPIGDVAVYLSYPPGALGHPADHVVELRLVRGGRWAEASVIARLSGGQGTINVNSWSPDGRRFAFVDYPLERRFRRRLRRTGRTPRRPDHDPRTIPRRLDGRAQARRLRGARRRGLRAAGHPSARRDPRPAPLGGQRSGRAHRVLPGRRVRVREVLRCAARMARQDDHRRVRGRVPRRRCLRQRRLRRARAQRLQRVLGGARPVPALRRAQPDHRRGQGAQGQPMVFRCRHLSPGASARRRSGAHRPRRSARHDARHRRRARDRRGRHDGRQRHPPHPHDPRLLVDHGTRRHAR